MSYTFVHDFAVSCFLVLNESVLEKLDENQALSSYVEGNLKINKHYDIDEWLVKSNIYWNDNGLDLMKMDRTTAYLYDCYVWAFHGKKWKDR